MVEQALQRGRRTVEGQLQRLAQHGGGQIHLPHALQHVGNEVALLESSGVAAVGDLVIRGAVDVVEDRARQAAPGHAPKIVEVMAVLQPHRSFLQNQASSVRVAARLNSAVGSTVGEDYGIAEGSAMAAT